MDSKNKIETEANGFINELNNDEEYRRFVIEYMDHKTRVEFLKQDLAIIEKSDEANMLQLLEYYNEFLSEKENDMVKKILGKTTEDTKDLARSGIIHSIILRRWLKEEEEIVAKFEEKLDEYTNRISRSTMESSIKVWFEELNEKLKNPSVKEKVVSDTYVESFIKKYFINENDPLVHSIKPVLGEYTKYVIGYDPSKEE